MTIRKRLLMALICSAIVIFSVPASLMLLDNSDNVQRWASGLHYLAFVASGFAAILSTLGIGFSIFYQDDESVERGASDDADTDIIREGDIHYAKDFLT